MLSIEKAAIPNSGGKYCRVSVSKLLTPEIRAIPHLAPPN
jgi:hypothetical protein